MGKFSLFMYEHSTNSTNRRIYARRVTWKISSVTYIPRELVYFFYRQELDLNYQEIQTYHPLVRELTFRRQQTILSYRLAVRILKITNDYGHHYKTGIFEIHVWLCCLQDGY